MDIQAIRQQVKACFEELATIGVTAKLFGSLCDGLWNAKTSDIDICITNPPKTEAPLYSIEDVLEKHLNGLYRQGVPIHISYYERLRPEVRMAVDQTGKTAEQL